MSASSSRWVRALPLWLLVALAACGGSYEGLPSSSLGDGGAPPSDGHDGHFAEVQPRLAFCRTCHVPGGIGEVENGRDFMLSPDGRDDYERLYQSWERLGGNAPVSRILTMASGEETPHSGGAPWPIGSAAYAAMAAQLECFGRGDCTAATGSGPVPLPGDGQPLLGGRRGGHAWFDFCDGEPDHTRLPPDPRALVRAGTNAGKAVHFNAHWRECHADPVLVGEPAEAQTCGELRDYTAQGRQLIEGNGAVGAGWYFGGNGTGGNYTAEEYNQLWARWGLPGRPDNFDVLAAQRYGMGLGETRNPYPLPGEDPNLTEGGSGQLPTGLTQLREADGRWTGELGVTCHVCHSGQIDAPGLGAIYGNGNSLSEFGQIDVDLGRAPAPGVPLPLPVTVGKTRGTNNALALQIITFLISWDIRPLDPNFLAFTAFAANGGSLDTPAWWNMGSRPVKFQDGFLAMGALRSDLGFYLPGPGPGGFDWVRAHVRGADTYLMSLTPPAWPGEIDTALAEAGAVLFHAKDLWAPGLENPSARPAGGNGSCASCHGAYSPRYVHDPAFLEDPALAGIASYLVPRDLVGTDPARIDSNPESAEEYGKNNFFAYPDTLGQPEARDCSTQNRRDLRGDRDFGYLAPPLHGIWASAPYFHNGSVPDLWSVLQPAERPVVWRRVSTPARADQAGQVVMGFDTDFARAYDTERLGWRYEVLSCGEDGLRPAIDCNGLDEERPSLLQALLGMVHGANPFTWYLDLPPMSDAALERRKVYNTAVYGQGAQGHDFGAVLSDAERRALIEYLKTL